VEGSKSEVDKGGGRGGLNRNGGGGGQGGRCGIGWSVWVVIE